MKIFKKLSLIAAVIAAISFSTLNVQALTIDEQLIANNRSHQYLNPVGLVLHDTDNEGATAQNNRDYFNRVYVAASAHYFVDWTKTIRTIPENEVAWHAGPTANHRYLSIEMCEPKGHNTLEFNVMYQKTVELAADICKRHNWTAKNIVSHYWCSMTFRETDHEDPIAFLREYNHSWEQLCNDIQTAIDGKSITVNTNATTAQPSQQKGFTYNNNAQIVNDFFYTRDSSGNIIPGRVDIGDKVTILDVSYSKQLIKLEYPTPNGVKTAWIKNAPYCIKYFYQEQYKNGSTSESVYQDSSLANRIGSVNQYECATVLYRSNNKLHVVYSTDKGVLSKSGFVNWNDHFNKF
jgi:N-acetyl-anhydromuramyl-L-alanine amidase AmpD